MQAHTVSHTYNPTFHVHQIRMSFDDGLAHYAEASQTNTGEIYVHPKPSHGTGYLVTPDLLTVRRSGPRPGTWTPAHGQQADRAREYARAVLNHN